MSDYLTETQEAVLHFIEAFIERKRYPPSRKEIADHFGWKSANAAQECLDAIERKGFIEVIPNISRGLRVL